MRWSNGICGVRWADHYKNFFTDFLADADSVSAVAAVAAAAAIYYYTWFDGNICSIFHWNYFNILFQAANKNTFKHIGYW